jgi:hypothetical protein
MLLKNEMGCMENGFGNAACAAWRIYTLFLLAKALK